MKQRISSLDIKLLTSEVDEYLKGYRLQNIYNLLNNSKSYLLKFAIPDSKRSLILDCGFKFHLTDFQRPTTQQPTNFVVKLRKHLKTKRLTNIKQVGDDRIVVLEFGDGIYYLVLEFFSAGNIILLDQDNKILSLQRLVDEKENNIKYAVGETYKIFDKSLFKQEVDFTNNSQRRLFKKEEVINWISNEKLKLENSKKDGKKIKILSIHKLLFVNAAYLSSDLIQIVLMRKNINYAENSINFLNDDEKLEAIVDVLNQCDLELNNLVNKPVGQIEGFIVSKKNAAYDENNEGSLEYIYDEFHPYNPIHKSGDCQIISIKGYNKTLDKFFTTLETSKNSLKKQQQELTAKKRLEAVKNENLSKINQLTEVQNLNVKKGELIMIYNDTVEACKDAVQTLIDQQMDWKHIEKLIQIEKSRNSEIAQFIDLPLNLKENKINLRLPDVNLDDEFYDESDKEEESSDSEETEDSETESDSDSEQFIKKQNNKKKNQDKIVKVTIDLSLSAYANASLYFDAKKQAAEKQQKTERNANIAIRNTELKINKDIKLQAKNAKINATSEVIKQWRQKSWFEKFFWFISSDNYLCIAGRDNAQTDLIFYKHFNNDNDYMVSSDIENSLKVFIKNPYKDQEIPPTTLIQAGIFSISATKAWDNKIVTSPWFVKGNAVSKKDFDGGILPAGTLDIVTEKNFLLPVQLVLGMGFLWIGDDETTAKYRENRIKRDQELGFKLVNDTEVIAKKIKELKLMIVKKGGANVNKPKEAEQQNSTKKNNEESDLNLGSEVKDTESKLGKDDHYQIGESINSDSNVSEASNSLESLNLNSGKDSKRNRKHERDSKDTKAVLRSAHAQANIRGKKSKMKKIKEKYADQDEEERKLRMQVLGHKVLESSNGENSNNVGHGAKDTTEPEKNIHWRQDRKKQQEINQLRKIIAQLEEGEEGEEEEEEREDENGDGEHGDGEEKVSHKGTFTESSSRAQFSSYRYIMDRMIASPSKSDVITDVIPVFAPWSSLQKFKYKIKIQPGNLKKGKVVNDIIEYFTKQNLAASKQENTSEWFDDANLIGQINQQDLLMPILVGKMKLNYPGGSNGSFKNDKKKK
ncbi:hypothetical protein PACTADRAFT_35750 [Pachysolen tannophilus NRRL Y-2460]|uniref:Ribosome quality control complex subunit 2 n=1 Tax=Pachysolen tannophilus NRRL Y-2460 TaxID=669874 RepID=A0A1E4TQH0_PACTA|nr:hypothetical protein PACTADRAFT_35750 [Pachysolen tannophilus NRRL Y-2460]